MEGEEGDPSASNVVSEKSLDAPADEKANNESQKCPPGMESLIPSEAIVVQEERELLEVFKGYEKANRHKILDSFGKAVYYAVEEVGCCGKMCFSCVRPFKIKILDTSGNVVLHIQRHGKCCCCFFFCCGTCSNEVFVSSGQEEQFIGKISQTTGFLGCCSPSFRVTDRNNKDRLKIKGSCCTCRKAKFDVQTVSEVKKKSVGRLSKEWGAFGMEVITRKNSFGVDFPKDLEPIDKSIFNDFSSTLLLASVMLVDMMYL